jgi:hypothetical protein
MIRIIVIPRAGDDIYGLLVRKELALRKKKMGTLHRAGPKQRGIEKWRHASFKGWITLQKCIGGTLAATVQSKAAEGEWQLLSSFIGFLHRHFEKEIASVTFTYDEPV